MIDNLVLIIGAMKAGTTTLFDHLATHPEIAGCTPKEPGFFAFDDIYGRGGDWYESLFAYKRGRHSIALDASTDYSKFPHCKNIDERIRAFGRPTKLIYIIRHPLRRIESHARHVQFTQMELGQVSSPITDHSLDAGVSPVSLDISRYGYQLDQYQHYFDRGDLLLISLEQLSNQPEQTLRKVYGFLGLEAAAGLRAVQAKNTAERAHKKTEAHPIWRAARAIAPLRATVKALVPEGLREKARRSTRPKVSISGRFKLNQGEEEALLQDLAPDMKKLQNHYGFDVKAAWGLDV